MIETASPDSMVFTPPSFTSLWAVGLRQISLVPGGQKPQKGTNGRCSAIAEGKQWRINRLRFLLEKL